MGARNAKKTDENAQLDKIIMETCGQDLVEPEAWDARAATGCESMLDDYGAMAKGIAPEEH